jgi:hypothetical protein
VRCALGQNSFLEQAASRRDKNVKVIDRQGFSEVRRAPACFPRGAAALRPDRVSAQQVLLRLGVTIEPEETDLLFGYMDRGR